jgi:hypothetical protein
MWSCPTPCFCMRVEWGLAGFSAGRARPSAPSFDEELAGPLRMHWQLHLPERRQRVAIMVTRQSHCIYDLLARWQSGELDCEIPLVHQQPHVIWNGWRCQFGCVSNACHSADDTAQGGAGNAPAAAAAGLLHRPGGAGPLHAGALGGFPGELAQPGDQHPPQFPARLSRGAPVPQRPGAGCETDRRHGPLCHRATWMRARSSSRK